VALEIGAWAVERSVLGWLDQLLMAPFFFLIALEIKRELVAGELRQPRAAVLPFAAAVGGSAVPAALFLLVNAGTPTAVAWGAPMATDVVTVLAVVGFLGDRVPVGVRVFLLSTGIVDDIAAIGKIAIAKPVLLGPGLALAAAALLCGLVLNRARVVAPAPYLVCGLVAWAGLLSTGAHAILAAVAVALTVPARARVDLDTVVGAVDGLTDSLRRTATKEKQLLMPEQQHTLERIAQLATEATPPCSDSSTRSCPSSA
jgi:NhaA family Na+:H+ antiporter